MALALAIRVDGDILDPQVVGVLNVSISPTNLPSAWSMSI